VSPLQYAALARNVDHLQDGDDRVPIITIHQAKGLEFDTVFIAGLFEGELPRRRSVDEGRLEEERRLFYVALTRARRRLCHPRGRDDYKLRARTVEPVFGQLKTCQKMTMMSRRGLTACQSEWLLACAAHNLRKLHRHRTER